MRDTRDLETSDRSKAIAVAMSSSPHADALTTYPLFAKPVAEASSIGIYPSSKIERHSELEPMVSFLNARSPDQDILIESYLAGREFTVGILGTGARARILGVLEFRFDRRPDGDEIGQGGKEVDFFTIELKKTWEPVEGVYVENLTPDMASDPEVQVVCERALQAYTTLGCRDYGRIDVRSDRKGPGAIPCIIEVRRTDSVHQPKAAQVTNRLWLGQSETRVASKLVASHRNCQYSWLFLRTTDGPDY